MNIAEYRRMFEAEDSHWWYVGLHELVLSSVSAEAERFGRPLQILDAGCGTGRLMQLMSAYGQVEGYDASAEAVHYCHMRGLAASQADLNDLRLEADRYEIITSIDVLYHTGIKDDVAVLKMLYAALKPGGVLILNLVAHEFLRSSHDIAVHTRERYTRQSLVKRVESAGFSADYASYRVCSLFPLIAGYRLLRRVLGEGTADPGTVDSDVVATHPLINALLLGLIRFENRLMKRCALPFGSSVYLRARKPLQSVGHAGCIEDSDGQ
jgi:SAM-dependent methyltransferase